MEKPGWKKEAVEAKLAQSVFDKWQLLAQLSYQIVCWDQPIPKKIQRLQELLSYLTPEEKTTFQITEDDEEELTDNYDLIKYYDKLLSFPQVFTGKTWLTSTVLNEEEKCSYLSKPKRETAWPGFWVDWDERNLTLEGKEKLIENMVKKKGFTLFGGPVDPRDVYCKLKHLERENDGWSPCKDDDAHKSFQHYKEKKKLDFGKDDPLIWIVDFYVPNSSMTGKVQSAYREHVLKARKLIGNILQRMMKKFEGKTVYVIPEERVIP